jgi:hypothetical protein
MLATFLAFAFAFMARCLSRLALMAANLAFYIGGISTAKMRRRGDVTRFSALFEVCSVGIEEVLTYFEVTSFCSTSQAFSSGRASAVSSANNLKRRVCA